MANNRAMYRWNCIQSCELNVFGRARCPYRAAYSIWESSMVSLSKMKRASNVRSESIQSIHTRSSAHILLNGMRSFRTQTGVASYVLCGVPLNESDRYTKPWIESPSTNWNRSSPQKTGLCGVIHSSSSTSRTAACKGVSPGSSRPPGALNLPAPNPRFLWMSKRCRFCMTKSNVAFCCGFHEAHSISSILRAVIMPLTVTYPGS